MSDLLSAISPYRTRAELETSLNVIKQAPASQGSVALIVRRPAINQREILEQALVTASSGLEGDNWRAKGDRKQPGGHAHPDMQLNLMNVRAIRAIAGREADWAMAGDQFYVDLDLSDINLPPGSQLKIGTALIEVTAEPHLGCRKFAERFGPDAVRFVNSTTGKALNLRGVNARVIEDGQVCKGDSIVVVKRRKRDS